MKMDEREEITTVELFVSVFFGAGHFYAFFVASILFFSLLR